MKPLVRITCMLFMAGCLHLGYSRPVMAASLLDDKQSEKNYLLTLSGTAGTKKFFGVKVLLSLAVPDRLSLNPYQLIIKGFPREAAPNTFFWNSEESDMTVLANQITCEVKRTYLKASDIHFFFLSPSLLAMNRPEKRTSRMGDHIRPTQVFAQAGKIQMTILADTVSGSVWLKGYDRVEKSYIPYSAGFTGKLVRPLGPVGQ